MKMSCVEAERGHLFPVSPFMIKAQWSRGFSLGFSPHAHAGTSLHGSCPEGQGCWRERKQNQSSAPVTISFMWSTWLSSEVKWSEVAQSRLTLCDPRDCSLPGSSHEIFQARVQEWVAISSSRGSSPPGDRTGVSRIVGRRSTIWATGSLSWLSSSPQLFTSALCCYEGIL